MRHIVLASALALGGVSSHAATPQTMFFHDGIMDIVFQEDFTRIANHDLPDSILAAIVKNFGEDTLAKAYMNELKEYKLELNLNDAIEIVYTDENGHWINK
ncbi:hypothetical protein [Formosa haliotis]|uniref:hypothetical protein n=1 Tax=Formosa haliotis TaxID=1555194 RepID=UPI000826AF3B|nr:hypothetical protein [Formosa haliotis]